MILLVNYGFSRCASRILVTISRGTYNNMVLVLASLLNWRRTHYEWEKGRTITGPPTSRHGIVAVHQHGVLGSSDERHGCGICSQETLVIRHILRVIVVAIHSIYVRGPIGSNPGDRSRYRGPRCNCRVVDNDSGKPILAQEVASAKSKALAYICGISFNFLSHFDNRVQNVRDRTNSGSSELTALMRYVPLRGAVKR